MESGKKTIFESYATLQNKLDAELRKKSSDVDLMALKTSFAQLACDYPHIQNRSFWALKKEDKETIRARLIDLEQKVDDWKNKNSAKQDNSWRAVRERKMRELNDFFKGASDQTETTNSTPASYKKPECP